MQKRHSGSSRVRLAGALAPVLFAVACGGAKVGPQDLEADSGRGDVDAAAGSPGAGDDAGGPRAADASLGADGANPEDAGARDAGATPADSAPPSDASSGSDAPAPAAATIALDFDTAANGDVPFATVEVSVGGGPRITAIVDTGSCGLRVLANAVPASAWALGTTVVSGVFGSGVAPTGVVAQAVVTIGSPSSDPAAPTSVTTPSIPVVAVTSVACSADHPACPAAGGDGGVGNFLFGGKFPAVLGLGLRAGLVASPLAYVATGAYLLNIPPASGLAGSIEVAPSAAREAMLGTVVQLASKASTTPSGLAAWTDTAVPFCLNGFCATGVLDSGGGPAHLDVTSAADDESLGVPMGATSVPAGTVVDETLAGTAAWSFTVSSTPKPGIDQIGLGATTTNNLGIAPFFQFAVLYDAKLGEMRLGAK